MLSHIMLYQKLFYVDLQNLHDPYYAESSSESIYLVRFNNYVLNPLFPKIFGFSFCL